MNCVTILACGPSRSQREYRVKFVENVDTIHLEKGLNGSEWIRSDEDLLMLTRPIFKDCEVYEDGIQALIFANKMVEDLGAKVTNGIYEIQINGEF